MVLKALPTNKSDISMRHLQILNLDRYVKDFEVSQGIASHMQLVVYNSIEFFLDKVRGTGKVMSDIHVRAINLPAFIAVIYQMMLVEIGTGIDNDFPFSRAVRVSEDYYQRMRKLVTNETSLDFNLTTTDECGNPYTYITKIAEYQTTYRIGFHAVLSINSWIKSTTDAFAVTPITGIEIELILNPTIKVSASKAPVCAEINELRSIQFYEDLYCRWRNVVFNCKNLLPAGNELKSDTLMALYYTSLDRAKKEAIPCLQKQQRLNRY